MTRGLGNLTNKYDLWHNKRCISVNFCYPNSLKKQGHNRAFKQNLDVFRLLEVSVPDKVGDGEEDEERSDVETPKEQPVDLVVEHLYLYLYLTNTICICI